MANEIGLNMATMEFWKLGIFSTPYVIHPTNTHFFQITQVFNKNIAISQQCQKQSLDSSAGYMYNLWVQQDITDDAILATFWQHFG